MELLLVLVVPLALVVGLPILAFVWRGRRSRRIAERLGHAVDSLFPGVNGDVSIDFARRTAVVCGWFGLRRVVAAGDASEVTLRREMRAGKWRWVVSIETHELGRPIQWVSPSPSQAMALRALLVDLWGLDASSPPAVE